LAPPLTATNQAAGVGRLPDGAAYYAAALKQMTTTEYTPEQVHALGLSEVARVSTEMDALLKLQGLSTGTVAERAQALHKDPRFVQISCPLWSGSDALFGALPDGSSHAG
jgi:uncharacterized protein (DUF885 family)